MAVKTFTQGEVLTTADTNTYLTNGGLVFVKQVTVGSAVSSVDVTSCFSATYSSYRVVVDRLGGITSNSNLAARVLVGTTAATTGYSGILMYATVTASGAYLGAADSNGGQWSYLSGTVTGSFVSSTFDILAPFDAAATQIGPCAFAKTVGTVDMGFYSGVLANTTSYDGIRFVMNNGTMTGGTITVYGYREQ
jgi:hypothetical protein